MLQKNEIQEIHQSNHKMVIAITGGGTEAISMLLKNGGGSVSILECIVPYSNGSLADFIGKKPISACSRETARAMAAAAYKRCMEVAIANDMSKLNLVGIGCSASLSKENEREGRQHNIYIAIHTKDFTKEFCFESLKKMTRLSEEELTAEYILTAIYETLVPGKKPKSGSFPEKNEGIYNSKMVNGTDILQAIVRDGYFHIPLKYETKHNKFIFPGSFNPIHEGHLKMIEVASTAVKAPISLEISLANVDKPNLDFLSLWERIDQIRNICHPDIAGIFVTDSSTFFLKSQVFNTANFLVGYDTITRINDLRYYKNNDDQQLAFDMLARNEARFLVFDRKNSCNGVVNLRHDLEKLCSFYTGYDIPNISSTELREKGKKYAN